MWGKWASALILVISVNVYSKQSFARTVEGIFQTNNDKDFYIQLKTTKIRKKLKPVNADVTTILNKLNSGDVILGQGSLKEDTVYMYFVDFVRLNNLVGYWENRSEGIAVDFISLNRMRITLNLGTSRERTLQDYIYMLSPSERTRWTIFIYDSNNPETLELIPGALIFNNIANSKLIKLTLYDPKTKQILFETNLLKKTKKGLH